MALIKGTKFADKLSGTWGNDTLYGEAGNDVFYASGGYDRIDGGAGWDRVDYSSYAGRLSVVLNGAGKSYVYANGVLHDTLVSIEEITGGSGDDYFVGNAYDNIFSGGKGHDYFVASAGNDAYRGGAGYDMLDFSAIKAGLRFDINAANGVTSVRYAGGGLNTMTGVENIIGTKFGDVIKGDGANNYFQGEGGNDTLSGGAGGDVLNGGAGTDRLTGGADADIFEFVSGFGRDTITDFDARGGDHDFIDLSGVATIASFQQLFYGHRIYQSGSDVLIDAARDDVIVLKNVDISDLSASHFLF
nr:M10 family metallopeptidase C-terminal domain-containing protein [uncultured Shinella sp.]